MSTHNDKKHLLPAVVLVNTGSPESTQLSAIKDYLNAFLADPYVIPNSITRFFLKYFIIPFYAKKSSEKYQQILTAQRFPLILETEKLAIALANLFEANHKKAEVFFAMRYGKPNLEALISTLTYQDRPIFLVPLYPQYTQATTGTVIDNAFKSYPIEDYLPRLTYLRDFFDDPGYIKALGENIKNHWETFGRGRMLLFSFHAIPAHWSTRYQTQCHTTVTLVAEYLNLKPIEYRLVFQSRFGRGHWTQPQLDDTLRALPSEGTLTVDIICSGFITENLETCFDIDQQATQTFYEAGGHRLSRIPCLNDQPHWVQALADIIEDHYPLPA